VVSVVCGNESLEETYRRKLAPIAFEAMDAGGAISAAVRKAEFPRRTGGTPGLSQSATMGDTGSRSPAGNYRNYQRCHSPTNSRDPFCSSTKPASWLLPIDIGIEVKENPRSGLKKVSLAPQRLQVATHSQWKMRAPPRYFKCPSMWCARSSAAPMLASAGRHHRPAGDSPESVRRAGPGCSC